MKLAVSGKGGVGKTTIASTLVRIFAEDHPRVFAIDADPDACLAQGVGIERQVAQNHRPVIELKEIIDAKNAGGGAFFNLNPDVDEILEEYCLRRDNIYFLRMGGLKKGGEACYCKENSFLNSIVNSLLLDREDVVILDMGAGIEHLSRGTARGVDAMLVVVEPSLNSVGTALQVKRMSEDLGIERVFFIGNKVRTEKEKLFLEQRLPDQTLLGVIPYDDEAVDTAMEDGAAISPQGIIYKTLKEIKGKLEKEVGVRKN